MTSMVVGKGCRPSIPVSNADVHVPGTTNQLRSTACAWPALIHPASCAVCSELATSPAATNTSTSPVRRKKRARSSRIPPR